MKYKEMIEEILFDKYLDTDVTVIFQGYIKTNFVIHNAKILLSENTLMITNTKKEEITICLNEVIDLKVNSCITFYFDNLEVTLDY